MNILLIAGGWSSERDVSLAGARGMARALRERGHQVRFFDLLDGFDALMATARQYDFAFINLHGAPGEDGLVQVLLDRAGCPYQGTGPAGSFLALHKAATKQVYRQAGLTTPDWEFVPRLPSGDWRPRLPFPLFVKGNRGGSSLHLSRVENLEALGAALRDIFAAGDEALLEVAVAGQDLTCGVLGGEALPPVLIVPERGCYFDYRNKYAKVGEGGAREICPAPLSEALLARVREAAVRAHTALGLKDYSRTDMILTAAGELIVLETNTLPGMTPTSLVPQEAAAVGMDFGTFLERLMALRLQRQA